jgi:ribonuclease P protein component
MRLSQENENRQGASSHQATSPCRTQATHSLEPVHNLRLRFPKAARLLKSDDFRRVKKYGKRIIGQAVVFDILSEKFPYPRLGLTVSKQFGKAHDRNRFKRLVREAFRLSQHALPPASIHVSPNKAVAMPTLKQLLDDFSKFYVK